MAATDLAAVRMTGRGRGRKDRRAPHHKRRRTCCARP